MSDRLAAAVRELEPVCAGLQEIVRVDVDDDGVLVLTAACAAGTRWFTRDGQGLVERFPQADGRVPLAALTAFLLSRARRFARSHAHARRAGAPRR